jgi:4-carboxymuconolactone decarboxylase
MARLPNYTDREQTPAELLDDFDRIAALRNGSVSGPYGVLLHSGEVGVRAAALGEYLRFQSVLTPAQRELAIITTAHELNADVMWAAHTRLGRAVGIADETIEVIASDGDAGGLSDAESEIVRYVRELLKNTRVSDEAFAALHGRLGDQSLVDLTGLVGYYTFVGSILNAFEIAPAEGLPPQL